MGLFRRPSGPVEDWQPRLYAIIIGGVLVVLWLIAFVVKNNAPVKIDFVLFSAPSHLPKSWLSNPAQRKALEEIAKATMPPAAPPEKTRIAYLPITRKIEGSEHVVTMGSFGSFSGHLMPGGMGAAAPKLANSPGADPIHKEYSQGRTTRQTYTDSGQKWDWANSNYMYATFNVTSEDYEKFLASMMQEMEKAKAKK